MPEMRLNEVKSGRHMSVEIAADYIFINGHFYSSLFFEQGDVEI